MASEVAAKEAAEAAKREQQQLREAAAVQKKGKMELASKLRVAEQEKLVSRR